MDEQASIKEADLSAIYPPLKADRSVYASKPEKSELLRSIASKSQDIPAFVNCIGLKTEASNLFIQLGYSQMSGETGNWSGQYMMSSETAKQLFLALAELFQCDISQKRL